MQHISHPVHSKKLTSSIAEDFIADLCKLTRKRNWEVEKQEELGLKGSKRRK
jgi:hypothetical protein